MIQIIGGGVIGLTTGLLLNLNGYTTEIYTKQLPYTESSTNNPFIATNYAAASVKPSTVKNSDSTKVNSLFKKSLRVFNTLSQSKSFVSKENHCILYNSNQETYPSYTDVLDISTNLEPQFLEKFPPVTDGFKFNCIFVEMPEYIPWLRERYIETGGTIHIKEITEFPTEGTVINCTGYGARELAEDESLIVKRGHLLKVNTPQNITHNSEPLSYVYSGKNSVYAYSRKDCLLLGGSSDEIEPVYDKPKEWNSNISTEVKNIQGKDIPKHIVSQNQKILTQFDIDIREKRCEVQVGFRPFRRNGLRVEQDLDQSNVYHNYGHGGAGVTLSWGSAYKILKLLSTN